MSESDRDIRINIVSHIQTADLYNQNRLIIICFSFQKSYTSTKPLKEKIKFVIAQLTLQILDRTGQRRIFPLNTHVYGDKLIWLHDVPKKRGFYLCPSISGYHRLSVQIYLSVYYFVFVKTALYCPCVILTPAGW